MRNVNPEWYYGWNQEPDLPEWDREDAEVTASDLDEPLCNDEGKPADDCQCSN